MLRLPRIEFNQIHLCHDCPWSIGRRSPLPPVRRSLRNQYTTRTHTPRTRDETFVVYSFAATHTHTQSIYTCTYEFLRRVNNIIIVQSTTHTAAAGYNKIIIIQSCWLSFIILCNRKHVFVEIQSRPSLLRQRLSTINNRTNTHNYGSNPDNHTFQIAAVTLNYIHLAMSRAYATTKDAAAGFIRESHYFH